MLHRKVEWSVVSNEFFSEKIYIKRIRGASDHFVVWKNEMYFSCCADTIFVWNSNETFKDGVV